MFKLLFLYVDAINYQGSKSNGRLANSGIKLPEKKWIFRLAQGVNYSIS